MLMRYCYSYSKGSRLQLFVAKNTFKFSEECEGCQKIVGKKFQAVWYVDIGNTQYIILIILNMESVN